MSWHETARRQGSYPEIPQGLECEACREGQPTASPARRAVLTSEVMNDPILHSFLARQLEAGMRLAADSDLLALVPQGGPPPRTYLAQLGCTSLVRTPGGEVTEHTGFGFAVSFPSDYLRRVDPMRVVTLLGPPVFHPNVAHRAPLICLGRLAPGTELVDILFQVWEILTFRKVTMREDDALNPAACQWARHNRHRFPVDPRPLKRRSGRIQVEEA